MIHPCFQKSSPKFKNFAQTNKKTTELNCNLKTNAKTKSLKEVSTSVNSGNVVKKMLESSISQNTLQFVSQRVFECICHLSHWGDPGEKPVLRNNTDIPGIDIVG